MAAKPTWARAVAALCLCVAAQVRLSAAGEPPTIQIARAFPSPRPGLAIEAIAADADDYVWAATGQGLFRFDGIHYHQITSEPLTEVAVTSDGVVWTAGPRGLAARQRSTEVRLLSDPVTALAARGSEILAQSGQIWRGTLRGLQPVGVSPNGDLSVDARQRVWFGCGLDLCVLPVNGPVRRLGAAEGVPPENWLGAIEDDAGVVWAWNGPKRLRLQNGIAEILTPWKKPDMRMKAWVDPNGRAWVDGPDWFYGGGTSVPSHVGDGLLRQSFTSDRYGRIWVAGDGSLALLAERGWIERWSTATFPVGAEEIIRTRSLGLIASTRNGLWQFNPPDGEWNEFPGAFRGSSTRGSAESRDGQLWSLFESRGILRVDRKGRETGAVFRGVSRGYDFRRLFRDRSGSLWVGAKNGLYRLDERTPELVPVPLPGGVDTAVAFARGPDGQEWMGSEAGIARLSGERWHLVIPADRLFNSRVRSIAVDRYSAVWVSYRMEAPFSRLWLDGGAWRRQDFTPTAGYGPAETTALLADRRGWVWRGTSEGLYVCDGQRFGPEDWIRLGSMQTLPSHGVGAFGLFEDDDGTVWVSSDDGVGHVLPDAEWFGPPKMKLLPRVTTVRGAGQEQHWPSGGERLPAAPAIEMDIAWWPDVRPVPETLHYRLAPRDREWRTADRGIVRLEGLPAGQYRLEMRVSPGGGAGVYQFNVPAMPVSWWWLPAGAICGGVALWHWRRTRMKEEYWRAKEAFLAAAANESAEDWSGAVVAERYAVERKIAGGGFSNVYLARDRQSGDPVALKVLFAAGEHVGRQRRFFEKEIEALQRLSHPGIVGLVAFGWLSEHEPYLVMPYVSGPTLRDVLRSGLPGRAKVADWVRQMGGAMAEAHRAGVLHRDLKPENVMIPGYREESERVVIVDFGGAAFLEQTVQQTLVLGSLPYLAPEQVQGRSSTASDVYSLTTIAFELLTGVRYASLADGTELGLRNALPGLHSSLIGLLAAGLAYVPADRPAEIDRFAEDLARAIEQC